MRLVRRLTGERRVGHTGTLDPAASGVLPVCMGQATRLVEYLVDSRKSYLAEVELGATTDTYDSEGSVTFRGDCSQIDVLALQEALERFRGQIRQQAPVYSALKHQGRPLYRYARAGEPVSVVKIRDVSIYQLEVTAFNPPLVVLSVECGKGTYIRSLAHDLGQVLGCGAYLRSLERTSVGPFHLQETNSPAEVEAAFAQGREMRLVYHPDIILAHKPAVILSGTSERVMRNGRSLAFGPKAEAGHDRQPPYEICRAYSECGDLIGLLRYNPEEYKWTPEKVFQHSA